MVLTRDGEYTPLTQYEALQMFNLADPLKLRLFKLLSFRRPIAQMKAIEYLLIDNVERHTLAAHNVREPQFWDGAVQELAYEAKAAAAKAEKDRIRRDAKPKERKQPKGNKDNGEQRALADGPMAICDQDKDSKDESASVESRSSDRATGSDMNPDIVVDDGQQMDVSLSALLHNEEPAPKATELSPGEIEELFYLEPPPPEPEGKHGGSVDLFANEGSVDPLPDVQVDDDATSGLSACSLFDGCSDDEVQVQAAPESQKRLKKQDDRSHLQPVGCILRKYKEREGYYWRAILPAGPVDTEGRRYRRRKWGGRLEFKTEEDVIAHLEAWLADHCPAGGPAAAASASGGDDAPESSSSSTS